MTNIVSLSATSNKFLNNDNHLNMVAVAELNDKINKIVKDLPVTNEKGKVIKPIIPEKTFTVNRRKKTVKFDSAANNRGDLAYLGKRAIPVKETRRLTDRGSIRNMAILTVYPVDKMEKAYGDDPFAKLRKSIKECVSAMATHMKRADKTKESVKSEKGKIRDASNAAFGKALDAFYEVLEEAGIDTEKDLIESSGMGGKSVLLKVGKDMVVSIGKSDMTKFKAAKAKAAAADDEDDAPAKKKIGAKSKAKKVVEKVSSKKKSKKVEEKPAKKKLKSSKTKDTGVTKLKKKKKAK